ncbi:unnamed protein product [Sphenostylis stenocarpa]|uniref:Histone deacetylase domain-containing protein n=1 Tax=Sphenostylis stenocarpa TaxID=92480 RepID=A0AA86VPL8_9FABA|nr:unnamed protein product [Sphenostylis stenocarpa]
MLFAGWFHYHKAAPKLAWFQDVESMLNHHLTGLLGLGSLFWVGHQIHVSLPINQYLNVAVDSKEIPLPHEFILNRDLLAQLYPSFAAGATPFFTLNWSKYGEFLTFREGLDPDYEARNYINQKVEVKSGTHTEEYLQKLDAALEVAGRRFNPELVIYNAGTDILEGDPLGRLQISPEGIAHRDEKVFRFARENNIPIVMLTSDS